MIKYDRKQIHLFGILIFVEGHGGRYIGRYILYIYREPTNIL